MKLLGTNGKMSRTIKFNLIMGALEAAMGSLHLFQSFLLPEQFAIVTMVLGIVHGVGGIYLRTITTTPLTADYDLDD